MTLPVLDSQAVLEKMASIKRTSTYYAMYSSLLNGIVTDPSLMILPIDDHIVHRGDGVFEAFRMAHGAVYDFESHLARMHRSADSIELDIPKTDDEIKSIVKQLFQYCPSDRAIVRLYVSRGPGGFTTSPYETVGSQVYIVITEHNAVSDKKYETGVSAKPSKISLKPEPWHQIKSCNYLPNVMMKKEALDSGVDFTVSVTPDGNLGEGSTENFALIVDGVLLIPSFEYTLKGTTLHRVRELAENHLAELGLSEIREQHISLTLAASADEMFFIGTTLEVLPVTSFNGKTVGNGQVGSVSRKLRSMLIEDMKFNSRFRTEVN